MKLKITTLTPIHVSSGILNPNFAYTYNKNNNDFYKYDVEKILCSGKIPFQQLNKKLLSSSSQESKKIMSNFFRDKVNYNDFQAQYKMESYVEPGYLDVSEQVKSLNRPYIPGSTLKGAIINCVIYYILKQNKEKVRFFLRKQNRPNPDFFEKDLFKELFDSDFEEVFGVYSSCIVCRDIFFDNMILCKQLRLNMGKNSKNVFSNLECIDQEQTVIDEFIYIDEHRTKQFKDLVKNRDCYKDLWENCLNVNDLLEFMRIYYSDISKEDKNYFISHKGDFHKDICDDIIGFYEKYSGNTKEYTILRLGKSTNYFYKSITLFIKRLDPSFYSRNFILFAPVSLNQRKDKKGGPKPPSPKKMPNSRVVITDDEQYYFLSGMLKIELCDKN